MPRRVSHELAALVDSGCDCDGYLLDCIFVDAGYISSYIFRSDYRMVIYFLQEIRVAGNFDVCGDITIPFHG